MAIVVVCHSYFIYIVLYFIFIVLHLIYLNENVFDFAIFRYVSYNIGKHTCQI